jgi:Xaa-Pro aminopeptidase
LPSDIERIPNNKPLQTLAASRLTRLRRSLRERSLDAILVTHLPHIRYLTGFTGSAGILLVTARKAYFVTDFRYQEQIREELVEGITGVIDPSPLQRILADKLIEPGMSVGFQDSYLTVERLQDLKKKGRKIRFQPTGSLVASLVMIKTDEEIASIKKAADIAARVFKQVLEIARPGMRELDLATEISYIGRKLGSEGDAFDIIVASGIRGALPHGHASMKKMKKGELVTLDFGCIHNGFNSDMTRTFALGRPSDEARAIYDIVLEAEQKGVRAARAGMTGKELDDICRDHIKDAGYGTAFGHSTGHGLGIEVHEGPAVSFRGADQMLEENMVVTIEPGIYLAGRCGVRIEDDVVITREGCRSLTTAPRDLQIL